MSERKLPGNKQCLRENYREISFLIHGCYCGNYDINIIAYYTSYFMSSVVFSRAEPKASANTAYE